MPEPSSRRTFFGRFSRLACFTLLAAALGYAAFDQGGQDPIGWNICLLLLGVGAVFYLLAVSRADRPPFMGQLFAWAVLLPPAYVGLPTTAPALAAAEDPFARSGQNLSKV